METNRRRFLSLLAVSVVATQSEVLNKVLWSLSPSKRIFIPPLPRIIVPGPFVLYATYYPMAYLETYKVAHLKQYPLLGTPVKPWYPRYHGGTHEEQEQDQES